MAVAAWILDGPGIFATSDATIPYLAYGDLWPMLVYLETLYLPSRVRVSPGYARNLRRLVERVNEHAGHAVSPAEFTEELIAGYLFSRAKRLRPVSLNNERRMLLTLCAAAFEDGLMPRPLRTKRIRRLPEPPPRPSAWTAEEIDTLLRTARGWPGMVGEIVAANWWASLIHTEYCTAARISALLSLSPESYCVGRGLSITEGKTGKTVFHRLPPACLAAIDAIYSPDRERLWPWPYHRSWLWATMRRIVKRAGVSAPPGGRQLFYRVRRTTLSYCWLQSPSLAQAIAGHSDQRVTQRYIDPAIATMPAAMDALPALS